MAAGSQALKGVWALLVNLAIKIKTPPAKDKDKKSNNKNVVLMKESPMAITIKESPTRFDNTVSIPDLKDLLEPKKITNK